MNNNWSSQKVIDWDDYINPRASRAPRVEYRTRPNGETYTVETSYRRDGRAFRVAVFEDGTTMDLD